MQQNQDVYINEDLLGYILAYLPYFYQWKFKRLNSTCYAMIEKLHQQFLLTKFRQSILTNFYSGDGNSYGKRYVQFNELNYVTKEDWGRLAINSQLESARSAISFLRKFYYLDNLHWLDTGSETNRFSDSPTPKKLKLSKLNKKYFISLSVIGLTQLREPRYDYADHFTAIGISQVYFMFCSPNLENSIPSHIYLNSIYNQTTASVKTTNDCFTYTNRDCCGVLFEKKKKINSLAKAKRYLSECCKCLNVDISWIPIGNLFSPAILDKKSINWERAQLLYGNYIIPMNADLEVSCKTNPNRNCNILQYLFSNILELSKTFNVSSKWYGGDISTSIKSFENDPIFVETKNRIYWLLTYVDEKMLKLLERGENSFIEMVKQYDSQMQCHASPTFKPFKWYDFVLESISTKSQNPWKIVRETSKLQ